MLLMGRIGRLATARLPHVIPAHAMDKKELISCMREAAAALAEFRHVLPEHSPGAYAQVLAARRHVERAVALLERAVDDQDNPPILRLVD